MNRHQPQRLEELLKTVNQTLNKDMVVISFIATAYHGEIDFKAPHESVRE